METDLTVTLPAFKVPNGTGPLDIRVVVSKNDYILSAEDSGCYYLQPVPSLTPHAEAPHD